MSKNFNETPYLVIVAVVAVVAIVTLLMNNVSLDGAPIYDQSITPTALCDVTNENLDMYTKGWILEGRTLREDTCFGDNLHQWTCDATLGAREMPLIRCEFGCENGACLRQETYR